MLRRTHLDNMNPMLHASYISQNHASKVAELEFANDLIRVLVCAFFVDDRQNQGATVESLLSTIPTNCTIVPKYLRLWENESKNFIMTFVGVSVIRRHGVWVLPIMS